MQTNEKTPEFSDYIATVQLQFYLIKSVIF